MKRIILAVSCLALLSITPAQAANVQPLTLEKCFNTEGGWVRDDLHVGEPCAPFVHKAKTLAYVKSLLIYNGFRPSMVVRHYWSRQFEIDAIQDGVQYDVLVVKSGPHQIAIRAWYGGGRYTGGRFNVAFIT